MSYISFFYCVYVHIYIKIYFYCISICNHLVILCSVLVEFIFSCFWWAEFGLWDSQLVILWALLPNWIQEIKLLILSQGHVEIPQYLFEWTWPSIWHFFIFISMADFSTDKSSLSKWTVNSLIIHTISSLFTQTKCVSAAHTIFLYWWVSTRKM